MRPGKSRLHCLMNMCLCYPTCSHNILNFSTVAGFGYDIAKRLHSIGFTLFAGCLEVDGYGASQLKKISPSSLHVISLDVTSDDSVNTSLEYVMKNLPKKGFHTI